MTTNPIAFLNANGDPDSDSAFNVEVDESTSFWDTDWWDNYSSGSDSDWW